MGTQKLLALTGLRAIAAFMILLLHSQALLRIPLPAWPIGEAVSLFFVLSGFVLAYAYPRLESLQAVRDFLFQRLARIWPAYLCGIALYLVFLPPGVDALQWQLPVNILMLQSWIPSAPWYFSYNGPSWSVSTEAAFYLAFPFLLFGWRKSWWWKWLGAFAIVAALVSAGQAAGLPNYLPHGGISFQGLLDINPLSRIFEFIAGMVACSLFRWLRPRLQGMSLAAASAIEVGVSALGVLGITRDPVTYFAAVLGVTPAWMQWLMHTSNTATFMLILVTLGIGGGIVSRVLGSRLFVLLGEVSYSTYLFHLPIYGAYSRRFLTAESDPDYTGLALCLAVTLLLSFVTWKYLETPLRNAAKRKVARARRPQLGVPAAVPHVSSA